jgi:hypothetical protein
MSALSGNLSSVLKRLAPTGITFHYSLVLFGFELFLKPVVYCVATLTNFRRLPTGQARFAHLPGFTLIKPHELVFASFVQLSSRSLISFDR